MELPGTVHLPHQRPSRRRWIPYLVLILSLTAAIAATVFVHRTVDRQNQTRFDEATSRTTAAISNRIDQYTVTLRNMVALFRTSGIPAPEQFRGYLQRLDIQRRYPGTLGIGFSLRVLAKDYDKALEAGHKAIDPKFHIWPADPPRDEYHVIFYIDPLDARNKPVLGYDMHTDPVRAAAMDAARDSGSPVASGKVRLIQEENDPKKQAGFLIYMPLYAHEEMPQTVAVRRDKLAGFIYAPFLVDDLLAGIFSNGPQEQIDFRVYDSAHVDAPQLMHDSSRFRPVEQTSASAASRYTRVQTIDIATRPWTIEFFTRPEFDRESNRWLTPAILVGGLLISLLFFVLTRSQVTALLATRSAMRELQAAKTAAEGANKAKDNFLAMLSHELRTPLAPALATATVRQHDPNVSADLREDMAMISRNIKLESRLIDDLLDLTRIMRGKLHLHTECIDAHAVLRETLKLCTTERAQEKKLNIQLHCEAPAHYVDGDGARLQQIFWNLLQNAVKFTPAGGWIILSTRNENGNLIVEIADTGIGIEQGLMAKLFDPFEQSEGSSRRFGGLGLGLSIARGLAIAHNGTIEARSAGKDHGSTFTVTLPAVEAPVKAPEIQQPSPTAASAAKQKLRVMLVEDHADTFAAMIKLLRAFGHDVDGAKSGAEAVDLGRRRPFDLLISDIGLPDISGYDLLRTLRANCNGDAFKGIALTGFGMQEDIDRAHQAGFDAHLTKPIDFTKLQATINDLVNK